MLSRPVTKRQLETRLGVLAGFDDPVAALEQYPTPPALAAHVIHLADLHGDIEARTVVDLGAGTGMLALGAALRGPARVIGVDIDHGPLTVAEENRQRLAATTPVHWVQADTTQVSIELTEPTTVVMNPPFGAHQDNRHADRGFLTAATQLADVSYSIHNAGSQEFVESFVADKGGEVTHAFAAELDLDHQYEHHTEDRTAIDAEVYRIDWQDESMVHS